MPVRSGTSWQVRILALSACFILSALHPGPSIAQEEPASAPPGSVPVESPVPDNAAVPSAQDNAAVPSAQDNAAALPAQDNAAAPPAQDNAAALPAQDNAAALPAQDNAAVPPEPIASPAQDNAAKAGLLDRTHGRLERGIYDRVIRLDRFFGTDRIEDHRQPDYLLRWRNSLRVEDDGRVKYRTTVHGKILLPGISNRLRLFISGETEADPLTTTIPEDPGQPGFDRTLQNTRLVNTELRYTMIQKPTVNLFLGAGIRVRFPVESFVRTRFHFNHRLGEKTLARFGETLFWKSTDGFGETTEIELDRQIGRKTVLRWANAGTVTEESRGLEWGSELSLLRELSSRSGITYSAGVSGVTDPSTVVETYRILTRYRRNFLRPWLYYELEPEVSWPREPDGSYRTAYAFTLRLEIGFQGTAAMTKKEPMAR